MSAVFTPTPMRITVERYQRMVAAGVLTSNDRVELIEGEILAMAPIGSRHSTVTERLLKRFVLRLGETAVVGVGRPVDLGEYSEPGPGLVLLRPRPDEYARSHPRAADVLLLVEVSDGTLGFDLGRKRNLYAHHGVSEYWVVDVQAARILVHRQPAHGHYQQTLELHRGEAAAPAAFPALTLPVAELFA